jgi:hypothetical protein
LPLSLLAKPKKLADERSTSADTVGTCSGTLGRLQLIG